MNLQGLLDLHVQNSAGVSWIQMTSIKKASTIGRSLLEYEAELPTGNAVTNKGYFVRIKTMDGHVVDGTYSTGDGAGAIKGSIKSPQLDFRKENYFFEFGPHYQIENTNAVAASVLLVQGRPRNFQASSIFYTGNHGKTMTFDYEFPRTVSKVSDVRVYLVEGKEILPESKAISDILKITKTDGHTGSKNLDLKSELEEGKSYTVCMGIFSNLRQIASNTFIAE